MSLDDAQITTEIVKRTGETSPRGPAPMQRISSRKSLTLIFKRKKSSNKMSEKKLSSNNLMISPPNSAKDKEKDHQEPASAPLTVSSLGVTAKVGSASAPGSASVPRKSPLTSPKSPTSSKHDKK